MERAVHQLLSDLSVDRLSLRLVGRKESFLTDTVQNHRGLLEEEYRGKRVLILGGAGFIAGQVLREILQLRPAYVGLVDLSENGLAEVIRSIRASNAILPGTRVEPWLVDIGSTQFLRVLREVGHVDRLLNFAAVKHVRSERDVVSLLRMLEVNILGTYRATATVAKAQPQASQFIVSTDKAADPANFMGASKRAMESVALSACSSVTMARFANVAFSAGSLLESWLRRISNGLPVSVPRDTWRYFVTPQEAGQICVLASVAPASSVIVPSFGSEQLVELERALHLVLAECGFEPERVSDVASGLALLNTVTAQAPGIYPLVVTARDTPGEKRAEHFLAFGEHAEPWIDGLDRVWSQNVAATETQITAFVMKVAELVDDSSMHLSTDDLARLMQQVVPSFQHLVATNRLDDRA